MQRHHNETLATSPPRTIPNRPQQAQLFGEETSYLPMRSAESSNSIVITAAPSAPLGTPTRKRWEGGFKKYLKGKNPENSTLSSSPTSASSERTTEDLSTGTTGSASSSVGGGGLKASKKKSSYSLISGSRKLVTRIGNSSFSSKGGALNTTYSRSHNAMDELDTPLRCGSQRSRSYGSSNSNPNSPSKPSLHRRDQSWGTGQGTENTKPTKIISATLPTARSSLNDQIMASSLGRTLSSIPAANHPYSSTPQLIPYSSSPQLYRERAQSGDFLMNPIANKGVENPLLGNTQS